MALFKTLTYLLRTHSTKSPLRVHSAHSSILCTPPFPSLAITVHPIPLFLPSLTSPRSRLFFPICGWKHFSGPRFLMRPAWKLLQSATPLYIRGREAILPGDLFRPRVFPIGIGSSLEGVIRDGNECGNPVEVGRDSSNESLFNLPNLISISRMVSGPFIGWLILNEFYLYAFYGLAVSGATDWLDGFVARKMNINSVIGSYLDPLADKILIVSVAVAMVKMDLLNPGLVGIVVLRDVALVGGAVLARASNLGWEWKSWSDFVNLDDSRSEKVEPLLISKVNTVFQLVLVAAALLQPELGTEEMKLYVTYLSWVVASTTTASFAAYIMQYVRRNNRLA